MLLLDLIKKFEIQNLSNWLATEKRLNMKKYHLFVKKSKYKTQKNPKEIISGVLN